MILPTLRFRRDNTVTVLSSDRSMRKIWTVKCISVGRATFFLLRIMGLERSKVRLVFPKIHLKVRNRTLSAHIKSERSKEYRIDHKCCLDSEYELTTVLSFRNHESWAGSTKSPWASEFRASCRLVQTDSITELATKFWPRQLNLYTNHYLTVKTRHNGYIYCF